MSLHNMYSNKKKDINRKWLQDKKSGFLMETLHYAKLPLENVFEELCVTTTSRENQY